MFVECDVITRVAPADGTLNFVGSELGFIVLVEGKLEVRATWGPPLPSRTCDGC